jgi:4-oxalocrotonate tautomerase
MPLVRIDVLQGKSAEYRKTISDVVHDAMVAELKVPVDDRFQVIAEHPAENHVFPDSYLGITHTQDIVFLQLTLNAGRSIDIKKAFYKAVADGLSARLGLRQEDVLISLVEVAKENWSFGNGEAQYA